ncbi:MAG: AI-2E family transporter [Rhodospirillales bacterium]|nr:AI-2E family transporter [Rhodospirillales bacterium]
MTKERQFWVWLVVLVIAISLIVFVSGVLLPFVAGMAVAYFLDPLGDKLESWGLSRTLSTVIITASFFITVIALLILIFPLIQGQIIGFAQKVPSMIESFEAWLAPLKETLSERIPSEKLQELSDISKSYGTTIVKWLGSLLGGIWKGGLALFNVLSLILITPVVSFYLLRDWDKIVAKVDSWLPRDYAPAIRSVVKDIDITIAGFVRGQGTVCLFLAVFYGVGLTIVGLDFGLVVGITTGLISFIPYFGMLVGMATALAIAIVQFGDVVPVVLVLIVFGAGQIIESMFLTPKLVGEKVGLQAVWVIFALMVGGTTVGFTGVLLAVPVAATIGVLVRFFLAQYLASPLYSGSDNISNDDGSS